jgi:hypothetical protein
MSIEGTLMVLGSRLFFVDIDSAVGYLHYADAGCVADVSEEHTASIFRINTTNEGNIYLRNFGNTAQINTVQGPITSRINIRNRP